MYISRFRIRNYKSFLDSGELSVRPGFSVVVGQNNAGKSALTEALSIRFPDLPHRSLATVPRRGAQVDPSSIVEFTVNITRPEVIQLIRESRLNSFELSVPQDLDARQLQWLVNSNEWMPELHVERYGNGTLHGDVLRRPSELPRGYVRVSLNSNSDAFIFTEGMTESAREIVLGGILVSAFSQRVYSFRAERLNVGRGSFGQDPILAPDASNLPMVLNILQGNRERYRRYNNYVSVIFPQVHHIQVAPDPSGSGTLQILVWTVDPITERDDLAVPLGQSGTGIGQVLAILYVVLTSDSPRTIVIDEPQSFLHPGAVRKLIEVLKQHPQHQFIITTHSATAITAAQPDTILLIRNADGASTIEGVDTQETAGLRLMLSEVGARLGDVFGSDNILWVEGRTEEICLPKILAAFDGKPLFGTEIIGVAHTGDFEGRFAKSAFDLYVKLTQGKGLLPPAVGFLFDREDRTDEEIQDLQRRSHNRIQFTTLRLYENYLIIPEAIAEVASRIDGFRETVLTAQEVNEWLDAHRWDRKFFHQAVPANKRTEEVWHRNVHGAKVLHDLFAHFSENRVEFTKVRDSVALTDWVLQHDPERLREFADAAYRLAERFNSTSDR